MCRDRWQPPPTPARAVVVDELPDQPLVLKVYQSDGAIAAIDLDAVRAIALARQILDSAARRLIT